MTAARLPYPAAARNLLRVTVIDAVDELVRSRGWAATTMSDVAAAAGVSRQTLYNEFGSRQALVEAYVTREIEALIAEVTEAVRANADDAHRALRIAFDLFLELASDEPVVQLIVNDAAGGELHQLLTGLGRAVAAERIAHLIAEVWPQVGAPDARLLAESLARLAISHALLPSEEPAVTARGVGRMLAPFVDELLGTSGA
jgi:AcrR family transcriptional regulator